MKRYRQEFGNAALAYLGLFSIGFFILTFIYDWIQEEKAYRQGNHPSYQLEQGVETFQGEKGFTVKY
ncbi:MAG: hypothetical protein KDD55_08705 [Bdellovibrionales bacterium]|nr:hypothetical protein [Bdellovibrionales bacterium]